MRNLAALRLLLLTLVLLPLQAWAHKPSDSYLHLDLGGAAPRGQWDIAVRDLDFALNLDANADGSVTWGELRARRQLIGAYVFSRLELRSHAGPCEPVATGYLIDRHSDGNYLVLPFAAGCPDAQVPVGLEYSLFFDLDPTHRGLARITGPNTTETAVLAPHNARLDLDRRAPEGSTHWLDFFGEGVWHIWRGFDHLLFLLTLLLPAVLRYQGSRWHSVDGLRPALLDTVKTVTAFTLAHSITLSLAVLQWVALPSRLVESAIALSVILASLNNLRPVFARSRWLLAFFFGLLHGFGFAGVLAAMGLPGAALLPALFSFNVGVEAGQLLVVGLVFPLLYVCRGMVFYQRGVLQGGSCVAAMVAGVWLVQRVWLG